MSATNLQRVFSALTEAPKNGYRIAIECGLSREDAYTALVQLYDAGHAYVRATGEKQGHGQGWCL